MAGQFEFLIRDTIRFEIQTDLPDAKSFLDNERRPVYERGHSSALPLPKRGSESKGEPRGDSKEGKLA